MTLQPTFQPKQTYKNRAEAYRLFVSAQNLPVGKTKFYSDAERLGLVNSDKSIDLAGLLAYVKNELKVDPASGQSLVQVDMDDESRKLDLEEKRLKIEKLKRDGRKDDKEYIKRETVNEREGALVGQILGEIRYQITKSVDAVIAIGKADPVKRAEIARLLDETVLSAFRAIYESGEIDITFEDVEE